MTERHSERQQKMPQSVRTVLLSLAVAVVAAIITVVGAGAFNLYRGYDASIDRALVDLSASTQKLDANLITFGEIALNREEFRVDQWRSLRTSILHVMSDGRSVAVLIPNFDASLTGYEEALIKLQQEAGSLRNSYEGGKAFFRSLETYYLTHDKFVESVQDKQSGLAGFWASLQ